MKRKQILTIGIVALLITSGTVIAAGVVSFPSGGSWDENRGTNTYVEDGNLVLGQSDKFDDGAIASEWTQAAGGGTISESGGTVNLAGQDVDWWGGTTESAPLMYRSTPSGNWTATVKVESMNIQPGQMAGLTLYDDRDNAYMWGVHYDTGGESIQYHIDKVVGDTGSKVTNASVSQTPAWFRIRHQSGTFYYDYSTDGDTWTNLHSTSELQGENIGIFAKDFGTNTNSIDAPFNNFTLHTENGTYSTDSSDLGESKNLTTVWINASAATGYGTEQGQTSDVDPANATANNSQAYEFGAYDYEGVTIDASNTDIPNSGSVLHFTTERVNGEWKGAVVTDGSSNFEIHLINSTDGKNWNYVAEFAQPGTTRIGDWGDDWLHRPSLEYDHSNDVYYMSFTGGNDTGSGINKSVGIMTNSGTFENLSAWEESPQNPVIGRTANDIEDVGDTELMVWNQSESGHRYWLVAQQQYISNNGTRWIYSSDDGHNWNVRNNGDPIVDLASGSDIWPGKPVKGADGNYYALMTKHDESTDNAWGFLAKTDDLNSTWTVPNEDHKYFPITDTASGMAIEFYPVDMGDYYRIYWTDKTSGSQDIEYATFNQNAVTVADRFNASGESWSYATEPKSVPTGDLKLRMNATGISAYDIRTADTAAGLSDASYTTVQNGDVFTSEGYIQVRVNGAGEGDDYDRVNLWSYNQNGEINVTLETSSDGSTWTVAKTVSATPGNNSYTLDTEARYVRADIQLADQDAGDTSSGDMTGETYVSDIAVAWDLSDGGATSIIGEFVSGLDLPDVDISLSGLMDLGGVGDFIASSQVKYGAYYERAKFGVMNDIDAMFSDSPLVESDAAEFQDAVNRNNETLQANLNHNFNFSTSEDVIRMEFQRNGENATRYMVADADNATGNVTNLHVVESTNRTVDTTITLEGYASAQAADDVSWYANTYGESDAPDELFVIHACSHHEPGEVRGEFIGEIATESQFTGCPA